MLPRRLDAPPDLGGTFGGGTAVQFFIAQGGNLDMEIDPVEKRSGHLCIYCSTALGVQRQRPDGCPYQPQRQGFMAHRSIKRADTSRCPRRGKS
jgi:hypothetical protein